MKPYMLKDMLGEGMSHSLSILNTLIRRLPHFRAHLKEYNWGQDTISLAL